MADRLGPKASKACPSAAHAKQSKSLRPAHSAAIAALTDDLFSTLYSLRAEPCLVCTFACEHGDKRREGRDSSKGAAQQETWQTGGAGGQPGALTGRAACRSPAP